MTVRQAISTFPTGTFAFVMATGIVSIAAGLEGLSRVSAALFLVNLIAFPLLGILLLLRIAARPVSVSADLLDSRVGPGVLTVVAGSCVLGNEIELAGGHPAIAGGLWILAAVLWTGVIYALFAAMVLRPVKPPLRDGIDGAWLLAVVATEALAIFTLGTAGAVAPAEVAVFASLCLFLLGAAFYVFLLGTIVYRWLFLPLPVAELSPAYWINMGAAAIATLAGARLLSVLAGTAALAPAQGFVFGATVLFWTLATWWIPVLVALFLWRTRCGVPLAYRVENWAIVFPLGMYTTATTRFSQAIGLPALAAVPGFFVWVALAAWCLTFAGMIRTLLGAAQR